MWSKFLEGFSARRCNQSELPLDGNVLALLLDRDNVSALEGTLTNGSLCQRLPLQRFELTNEDDANSISEWLANQYAMGHFESRRVLVVLSRSVTLSRQFVLPEMSTMAAQEAIRLQTVAWLPQSSESYLIDSLTANRSESSSSAASVPPEPRDANGLLMRETNRAEPSQPVQTTRRHHVVAVERHWIHNTIVAIEQAGAKIVGLTTTMSAAASIVSELDRITGVATDASPMILAMSVRDAWELTAVSDNIPLGGLTVSQGESDFDTLTRLQQGATRLATATGIESNLLTRVLPGSSNGNSLTETPPSPWRITDVTMASLLEGPRLPASPHEGDSTPLLCGMLAAGQGRTAIVDLFPALRRVQPRRFSRRAIVAAGIVGLFLLGSLAVHFWNISALDQQIAQVERDIEQLDAETRTHAEPIKIAAEIGKFEQQRFHWSRRLVDLAALLPEEDSLYFSSIHLRPQLSSASRFDLSADRSFNASSTSKDIAGTSTHAAANLHLTGYARDEQELFAMLDRVLARRPDYQLVPHGFRPTQHDDAFGLLFELEVIDRRRLEENSPQKLNSAEARHESK